MVLSPQSKRAQCQQYCAKTTLMKGFFNTLLFVLRWTLSKSRPAIDPCVLDIRARLAPPSWTLHLNVFTVWHSEDKKKDTEKNFAITAGFTTEVNHQTTAKKQSLIEEYLVSWEGCSDLSVTLSSSCTNGLLARSHGHTTKWGHHSLRWIAMLPVHLPLSTSHALLHVPFSDRFWMIFTTAHNLIGHSIYRSHRRTSSIVVGLGQSLGTEKWNRNEASSGTERTTNASARSQIWNPRLMWLMVKSVSYHDNISMTSDVILSLLLIFSSWVPLELWPISTQATHPFPCRPCLTANLSFINRLQSSALRKVKVHCFWNLPATNW